jgi:hypothetical protein
MHELVNAACRASPHIVPCLKKSAAPRAAAVVREL